MGIEELIQNPIWKRYSKKLCEKIARPTNSGFFKKEEAEERQMHLVSATTGSLEEGCMVSQYWLVDLSDGIIVDAKFQVFGPSALIAALDAACDLLVGKNIIQAKRISSELIDIQLRDKADHPAFPEELFAELNVVIDVIEKAFGQCQDIPMLQNYVTPLPREDSSERESGGYPGWLELPREKKLSVIEQVFNEDIRPYIELDSGGIEILDLIGDKELIVSYQGACTSCFSSIGATLSTIQQIVQDKIHPELVVVPNLDDLKF